MQNQHEAQEAEIPEIVGICKYCGGKSEAQYSPNKCNNPKNPNETCARFFPLSKSEMRRLDFQIGAKNRKQ